MTLAEMARYFAEHAASDLKYAQTIARSDQSGHSLATAMYLAQQSIEKQLKSVVINMDKKMKLGKSESIAKALGHHLYPKLYEIYDRQIADLDDSLALLNRLFFKDGGNDAKNMAPLAHGFKLMNELWTMHLDKPKLQSLLWQNYTADQKSVPHSSDVRPRYAITSSRYLVCLKCRDTAVRISTMVG